MRCKGKKVWGVALLGSPLALHACASRFVKDSEKGEKKRERERDFRLPRIPPITTWMAVWTDPGAHALMQH